MTVRSFQAQPRPCRNCVSEGPGETAPPGASTTFPRGGSIVGKAATWQSNTRPLLLRARVREELETSRDQ